MMANWCHVGDDLQGHDAGDEIDCCRCNNMSSIVADAIFLDLPMVLRQPASCPSCGQRAKVVTAAIVLFDEACKLNPKPSFGSELDSGASYIQIEIQIDDVQVNLF